MWIKPEMKINKFDGEVIGIINGYEVTDTMYEAYKNHIVATKPELKDAELDAVVKTEIKNNVNPRKWMCVEVPKEDVIVKSKGDLIILIMVADEATRTKIETAFDNL